MQMKFLDHLHEARRRILWILLSFLISGASAYVLRTRIIAVLQRPLHQSLYYTSPAGGFNFVMEAAFLVAVFITLPVLIYQVVRFVEPALPMKIKNVVVIRLIASSVFLAVLGAAFAFYVLIPESLHFFASYGSATVKPLISTSEYLDFVSDTIISFAVIFQIPLLLLFINRVTPLKPKKILSYQKLVIVGSFVIAVILPFTYSPITQFIVVIPIVFLYYLSVVLLAIVNRGHKYEDVLFDAPLDTAFEAILAEPEVGPRLAASSPLQPKIRGISIDGVLTRPTASFTSAINRNRPVLAKRNRAIRSPSRNTQAIDGFFY